MDRRQFIALAGGAAVTASASIRAAAQGGAGTVTFGQSTAVLTLDSASGAFTGYPAGYEAALCIYDRLLDFDANIYEVKTSTNQTKIAGTIDPSSGFIGGVPDDAVGADRVDQR